VYMMDMYYDMQRRSYGFDLGEFGLGKMAGQDGTIEDYRILVICKIQLFTLHRIYLPIGFGKSTHLLNDPRFIRLCYVGGRRNRALNINHGVLTCTNIAPFFGVSNHSSP